MSDTTQIVRYNLKERAVHAVSAVSYVYLLLTGLAFWTPALYWLAIVLGGGYLSRLLHPWIGLIFTAAVAVMYTTWRRDMKTTPQDLAWRKAMGHYVRNEDAQVPPAGRFNYGQKQLFWVMVLGGVALFVSGLALWGVALIPWELRGLRYAAVLVHSIAALVTIAGFIVHLYMGLAVVPGGLSAILHGNVSAGWARHHHPLWVTQRVQGPVPPDPEPRSQSPKP